MTSGASYDYDMQLVRSTMEVNHRQRIRVVEKHQDHLEVLRGTTIGILGLSFKGDTDDLRDAPAPELTLIERLGERGAMVRAHDPVSIPSAPAYVPDLAVEYAQSESELARRCDDVVIATGRHGAVGV